MASATAEKRFIDRITCRQILNFMVILGFMFNYMLRVNLTIAIVEMVEDEDEIAQRANSTDPIRYEVEGAKFHWDKYAQNEILGSFFWGYVLTELPGGRLAEIIGAKRVFGGGMLAASILTVILPGACHLGFEAVVILRVLLGFFLGATWPSIPPMAAKWIPPMERSKFIANMMASSLGAALTMPVCGFLIAQWGWESVFYITGGIGVVWAAFWFYLIFGQDPAVSVAIFTCSLFFNGAVTAGYLANGLDIAPNFSGTIFGMANTLSSLGGWLSTFMVAVFTHENHTFEQWRYVFWILVAVYTLGALVFLALGSGEPQPWNSADAPLDAKEMQPLKTTPPPNGAQKEVA